MAEGDIFDIGPSRFSISYHGGDGNDVALTHINIAPTLDAIPDRGPSLEDVGTQPINLAGIGTGGVNAQTLTVTASSSNPGLIPNLTVNSQVRIRPVRSLSPGGQSLGHGGHHGHRHGNGGTPVGGEYLQPDVHGDRAPVNDTRDTRRDPGPGPGPLGGRQTINLSGISPAGARPRR